MTHSKCGIVLIGLSLAGLCPAQHTDSWSRLQVIRPSAKVEVRNLAGERVSGAFEQATEDSIQVRTGKGIVATAKADVASVSLLMGRSRGKRAVLGFAAGAAVMGTLVAIACTQECYSEAMPYAAGVGIPVVGAVSAGIAALFPQHREAVYVAPQLRGAAGRSGPAQAFR